MKNKNEVKGYADGIPVYCAHDAVVPVSEMRPNPKNPNTHPEEQLKRLGAIIRGAGWRNPITVSTRSGLIVRGHGRLAAAQMEGLTEVPVDYQNYASDAEELADLVADNRIAELADPDMQKLAEIFEEIVSSDTSIDMTGYNFFRIQRDRRCIEQCNRRAGRPGRRDNAAARNGVAIGRYVVAGRSAQGVLRR